MSLILPAIIQALLGTFTAQNCKVDPAMPASIVPTNAVTVTIETNADNGVGVLFDDIAHSVGQQIEFYDVNGAPYTVTGPGPEGCEGVRYSSVTSAISLVGTAQGLGGEQCDLNDGDLDVHTLTLNHDGSVLYSEQYTFAKTGEKVIGSCLLKRKPPSNS